MYLVLAAILFVLAVSWKTTTKKDILFKGFLAFVTAFMLFLYATTPAG